MLDTAQTGWHANAWDLVAQLDDTDGSATHRHLARLLSPAASQRDLSDAIHALCAVHGVHPGIAAEARVHCVQPDACDWLDAIAEAFAGERAYIARLAAAVGPLPSTPGQAETESALTTSRHALEMLGKSERRGCATGAIAALVRDWGTIRRLLDRAAARFGIEATPSTFPPAAETAASVAMLGASAATERAVSFGAQQLLAQHRAIWDLLEARASARDG
ncbi:hypothetical protein M9979_15885 [Sphingomonas sp. RP10(2022)]|uniref:Uncharacterized protein n=1 Tax=Sphingomonas liriopis TaxID=2949094 RepID=A0A9X2KUW6_9SPHN|nr:hypothetical protein [Sphingomonas liriopis]MCP3736348.1 hypothetical protein [Sphingomonas liriopis]